MLSSDINKKIKPLPLWLQVKDELEHEIINHVIPPGSSIKDTVLSERFGVSRGPVREALLCLQNEGWVEFKHNYGVSIKNLDTSEIIEVFEIREMIETWAARFAPQRITPGQLEEFDNIYKLSIHANEVKDLESVVELNSQFHELIVKATQNTLLQKIHKQYIKKIAWYLTAVMDESINLGTAFEHSLLIDAIRNRDSEKAIEIITSHNRTSLDLIMNSLRK